MSGDSLSQEEIDALLAGGGDAAPAEESTADADANPDAVADPEAPAADADAETVAEPDDPGAEAEADASAAAPEGDGPEGDAGDADAASDEPSSPAMAAEDNRKVAPNGSPTASQPTNVTRWARSATSRWRARRPP
ncbi:MAG: hypothetical protein R2878_10740 [Thermoleophilia bacterium]